MDRLKLIALDEEDLGVVSAHVQDAVGHARALEYRPGEATFSAALNRYVWERDSGVTGRRRTPERRRALLRFASVRGARHQNFQPGSDQTLSLLALRFEPKDGGPEGAVELVFSGGATIRLDVECIEARLVDTDAAWAAGGRPDHDDADHDDAGYDDPDAPAPSSKPVPSGT